MPETPRVLNTNKVWRGCSELFTTATEMLSAYWRYRCSSAFAQTVIPINYNEVISLPPVTTDSETPPAFNEPGCMTVTAAEIDPQNKALWLKAKLELPRPGNEIRPALCHLCLRRKRPAGCFLTATIWAKTGTPSLSANKEFAGLMDTELLSAARL